MDASPSKVWLARDNGTVTVVDRASEKKLADVDVTAFASNPEESVLLPSIIDVHGSVLYLWPTDVSSREALEFDADTGKTLQTIPSPTDMYYPVIVR